MRFLRNVGAIVGKEWRHYVESPIAYVTLFVWSGLFGSFFILFLNWFLTDSVQMEMGMPGKLSLGERVIQPVIHNMAVVALFLTPMLTMRLFAEEKRQGTLELLATLPLTDLEIVIGKFLAATSLYATMILVGFLDLALIWVYAPTPPEWKPVLAGALALLLVGAALQSLGLFVSSLTQNQIVAGIVTFCLALGMWILNWMDDPAGGPVKQAIAYLGLTNHMSDLIRGVIEVKDLVYYATFIALGLFLTHRSMESHRWRA